MMTLLEYETTKIKIERENEEKLKHYPILEKQLKIADSYLQVIVGLKGCKCFQCVDFARRARKKIKELEKDE